MIDFVKFIGSLAAVCVVFYAFCKYVERSGTGDPYKKG